MVAEYAAAHGVHPPGRATRGPESGRTRFGHTTTLAAATFGCRPQQENIFSIRGDRRYGPGVAYCLRIRFTLGPGLEISSEASELSIPDPIDGKDALLRGEREKNISESKNLSLTVRPFVSELDATGAADRWIDALKTGFARVLVGADFGERAPQGVVTAAGIEWLESEVDQRVLNDVHGASVYECEPDPRFARMSANAIVGKPLDRVLAAISLALENRVEMSTQERLSYDLFAASSREFSVDARFVMLMMAVETLIRCDSREKSVRDHVSSLISATKQSGISKAERDSIVGSLKWLLDESINQAGRKLAATLGERRYMGGMETPEKFFSKCYNLRSALVHGADPRPSRETVGDRTAQLEWFVADLLSMEIGGTES